MNGDIEVYTKTGQSGVIPFGYTGGSISFNTSADGELIVVQSPAKGLQVYGRDLKPRWELKDVANVSFAPVAKLFWVSQPGGVLALLDADGKELRRFGYDSMNYQALPGGPAVMTVTGAGGDKQCVVTPRGAVYACYPWIIGSTAVGQPYGSFFWTSDGRTISAFTANGN